MAISSALAASGEGAPGTPDFFHRATFTVGGDNYVTNGLAWDPIADITGAPLHGKTVVAVIGEAVSAAGHVARYDHAAKKVEVFYGDYSSGADAVLTEYPNSTALTDVFEFLIVAR
jgi:hypothetical protein